MRIPETNLLKTFLRYALRGLAAVLLILTLAATGLWIYVSTHKAAIISQVKSEINDGISGEIGFDDISITFFHPFGKLSVGISDITVRDSLWRRHHRTLFQARRVYTSLSLLRLLTGKASIEKVTIEDGSVHLFQDSVGYSNSKIFRDRPGGRKAGSMSLPDIDIKNTKVEIELEQKNKYFAFAADRLLCEVKEGENTLLLKVDLSARIYSLAFNTNNGGFAENKPVSGRFQVLFNPASKVMQFDKIGLNIDQQPFLASGKFFLGDAPVPFTLALETGRIAYNRAVKLVSRNIREKLEKFYLGEISSIQLSLDGTDPDNRQPLIRVKMLVRKDSVGTAVASFGKTSFAGYFTNEWKHGLGRGDDNSALRFSSFSGTWQTIPLKSDSILIVNLLHPVITCDLHCACDLALANDLFENRDIQFTKGSGRLTMDYQGPLEEKDSSYSEKILNGFLALDSVSIQYVPKNFDLSRCSGIIQFQGEDLMIKDLAATAGSTELRINAAVRKIFSLLGKGQERPAIECSIVSPKLDLDDFTVFLKKKSVRTAAPPAKHTAGHIVTEVFNAFSDHDALLQMNAKRFAYRKFLGSNLSAQVQLKGEQIILKEVALDHGGGSFRVRGSVFNGPDNNPMKLQASLRQVDITKVFTAFDNFGQHAILDRNLKGKLDLDAELTGMLTDKASVVPNSLAGTIDFSLSNGELIGYEPVEKVGDFVFKNRDFSDIKFASLQDKLELNGPVMTVNRMVIRSTVLTLAMEGTYDFSKGTDMSLAVPLSNLKDQKDNVSLYSKGVHDNLGISVHLRARTGDDGKLKITWDPFQKALKKSKKSGKSPHNHSTAGFYGKFLLNKFTVRQFGRYAIQPALIL